ncbi:unnamed protein product [Prunus armeniaca]
MSSGDDSKAPSSQAPLYLWGGSLVPSKKFVANLHRVMTDGQFQKWRAAFASTILDEVQVKLLKSRSDNEPLVDATDPGARIITSFLFLLGLQIPAVEALQGGVLHHGVCSEPVYPQRLPGDHVLRESEPFLHVGVDVRHFERYAQVRVWKTKLFDGLSQGDHAWHDDVLEVSGRWEGDVGDSPLVPTTYCYVSDISKQLELGPDMAKVCCALNIPLKFREWRWLLSEYREVDAGLSPAEDVERWKQNGPNPDDLPAGQEKCSAESPPKRKAAAKSSRGEATSSHEKNGSPSRKKPRLPSAEKTQVGYAPSSSTRVKHTLENHDVLCEATRAQPKSAERQRDVDIPPRSLSRLHRLKDGDRSGKSAHDPVVESRAVKRGVDSVSLTHLEMRLAEAKRMRESSAQAKCSSLTLVVDPNANKSSPAGDACVSDLLKMNFLSNPSSCAELVDHIRQAGDLGTF